MNKYLLIYRKPSDVQEQPTPEQMKEMYAQWDRWKSDCKANMVDIGDGLKPEGRLMKDGKVTDGPHIEAKEVMGGFSIIQAEGWDQAVEVARSCPMNHMPGASIEIREMMGFE